MSFFCIPDIQSDNQILMYSQQSASPSICYYLSQFMNEYIYHVNETLQLNATTFIRLDRSIHPILSDGFTFEISATAPVSTNPCCYPLSD